MTMRRLETVFTCNQCGRKRVADELPPRWYESRSVYGNQLHLCPRCRCAKTMRAETREAIEFLGKDAANVPNG